MWISSARESMGKCWYSFIVWLFSGDRCGPQALAPLAENLWPVFRVIWYSCTIYLSRWLSSNLPVYCVAPAMPEAISLYFRNRQFAVVENPGFWNWTFSLMDEDDKLLAQIDRNWRGIGFEVISFSVHTVYLSKHTHFLYLMDIHMDACSHAPVACLTVNNIFSKI